MLAQPAFASQNIVIDTNVEADVFGNGDISNNGFWDRINPADLEDPNNNSVSIEEGAIVDGYVYGAYAISNSGATEASDNKVSVSDGSIVTQSILGGYARNQSADSSGSAIVSYNSVSISDSTATSYVYGGSAYSAEGTALASYNTVSISSGSMIVNLDVYGGNAYSNGSAATALYNSVSILSGSTVEYAVHGGSARSDASANLTVSGNTVTISDSTVNSYVYGGRAYSAEGNVTTSHNSVSIFDSTLALNVYGGYADPDGVDKWGSATHNKIYIANSTILGAVFGGYSLIGDYFDFGGRGVATYNTITIAGPSNLTAADLFGGVVSNELEEWSETEDYFTGNTLNVCDVQGQVVKSLSQFEYINFALPTNYNTAEAALIVSDEVDLYEYVTATHRSSTITVTILGNQDPLQTKPGTKLTLIEAASLHADKFNQSTAYGQHGVTLRYTWALDLEGGYVQDGDSGTLTATLISVDVDPQVKALAEGFISGIALVEQSGELVVNQGLHRAVLAGQVGRQVAGQRGIGVFGALSGGKLDLQTGSQLELSSLSLLAGLSRGLNLSAGHLTLGGFVEYGHGQYDAFNTFNDIFNNQFEAHGNGTLNHFGGGLLGQMDFADHGKGHAYLEASLRFGQLNNAFSSSDLQECTGPVERGYEAKSAYFGLHLGAGYVLKLGNSASLDLYGKYFWTRLAGDTVTLSGGEVVDFAAINSHRVRAGLRLNYAVSQMLSPYAGLAVDYTFGGKAKATTYGIAIDAPTLEGATGLAELGLSLTPLQNLSLDLGVQGYVGVRKGISGSLQVRFAF